MRNKNLNDAKVGKKDEFYTQLIDIEKEIFHYKNHFKDKIVYCNCDDPFESNFFKYFVLNFNILGIKKLISTYYTGFEENKINSYKFEINEVNNDLEEFNLDLLFENKNNHIVELKGNGDFRSKECIEILKESDIIVTNPPFSLFREYVSQLFDYNKKFLIIGNINAVTYKEIFKLIKENKLWLGSNSSRGSIEFNVPKNYPLNTEGRIDENGNRFIKFNNIRWFTNLDYKKRYKDIDFYKNIHLKNT